MTMTMGSRISGGVEVFPTTPSGYQQLLSWLAAFGEVEVVGWRAPVPTERA
jgi:hypothetical protein